MIFFCIFVCFIAYLIYILIKTKYRSIRDEFPTEKYFEKNKLPIKRVINEIFSIYKNDKLNSKQILSKRSFEKIDKLDEDNQIYSKNNLNEINDIINNDFSLLIFSILSMESKLFRTNILYNKSKNIKNPYFYKTLDLIRGEIYLKDESLVVNSTEKYYELAKNITKKLNY